MSAFKFTEYWLRLRLRLPLQCRRGIAPRRTIKFYYSDNVPNGNAKLTEHRIDRMT